MNGLSPSGSGYGTKEISCCACVVPEQTKPSKGATTARNVAHWTTPTRTKDQRSHASFQEQWRLHETISCAREKYHLCQPTGNRHYLQGNRNVFFFGKYSRPGGNIPSRRVTYLWRNGIMISGNEKRERTTQDEWTSIFFCLSFFSSFSVKTLGDAWYSGWKPETFYIKVFFSILRYYSL